MADIAQLIVDQNLGIEARKKDFYDATSAFVNLFDAGKAVDIKLKKDALFNLYHKAKVYFSYVESCIVEGCVAGAFDHPSWLDDTASSAEKVLRGVLTLYAHLRRHRNELDFTSETFEPSGNIFQNMQGILALRRPEKAKELKQQFIEANLPHDWFDKPLKCKPMKKNNPWISGLFYLFATVVILAVLATIAKVLNVWILPVLVLGGLLLLTVIGAFQLRNDSQIEEKNFLALMKLAFQQIPLLGKLLPQKKPE